jgi:hypothetical protein
VPRAEALTQDLTPHAIAQFVIGANGSVAGTLVSFTKNSHRRFDPGRTRFVLPRAPSLSLLRIALLALAGIVGAGWALARHYTRSLPPMRVPVQPSTAPTYDPDAGEMPVPDLDLGDGG